MTQARRGQTKKLVRVSLAVGLGLALASGVISAAPVRAAAATPTQMSAASVDSSKMAFNLPGAESHTKMVFAHYWPPNPLWIENPTPDVNYLTQYLDPRGENGKHYSVGGLQRDLSLTAGHSRAMNLVNYTVPSPASMGGNQVVGDISQSWQQWKIDDMATEIGHAQSAGIDGFALNLFNLTDLTSDNGPREMAMLKAASATNFKIMLQPDMSGMESYGSYANLYANRADDRYMINGHRVGLPTPRRMAENLRAFITLGGNSIYRINGKVVVSPFVSDTETGSAVQYWREVRQFLLTPNQPGDVAYDMTMYPVFVNPSASIFAAYAPISTGASWWGSRSPDAVATAPAWGRTAKAYGLNWMAPVAAQDARPKSSVYSEAGNTATLRASWDRAITGRVGSWVESWRPLTEKKKKYRKLNRVSDVAADMVLMPTWNDYTESTSFAPSKGHGWALLDINAYYMNRFQVQWYPKLVRNAIYVSHRVQFTGKRPALAGTSMAGNVYSQFQSYAVKAKYGKNPWEGPRMTGAQASKAANRVEVLTMLPSARGLKIKVTIGSNSKTYPVKAGVYAQYFALDKGAIKVQLLKKVGKKYRVIATATTGVRVGTQATEDLSYHYAGSLR